MGKLNMDLYRAYLSTELEGVAGMMREYQQAMLNIILAGVCVQEEKVGPRDWSPRTGRCLCPKHGA